MKAKLIPHFGLLFLGLALSATPAAAQWSLPQKFDDGIETAVAVHPSGLVLEFHRTQSGTNTLWYHVGKVNGIAVTWGGSQRLPELGTWPNVAVTKEGYVLFVWSTGSYKSSSKLNYMVGKINPNGDVGQTISWLTMPQQWDAGFHSSIVINDNGVIVGVHESGSGGRGIYYRVGHFANPAGGNFNIIWDSGSYGINYDDGINPHIALNSNNQVVEVHQVQGEYYLHYHRGVVLSNGRIDFYPSQRYSNDGSTPAVTLLDSGTVLEVHEAIGPITIQKGILSLSNPYLISWTTISPLSRGTYPAIAAKGAYAIATFQNGSAFQESLYYTVAEVQ